MVELPSVSDLLFYIIKSVTTLISSNAINSRCGKLGCEDIKAYEVFWAQQRHLGDTHPRASINCEMRKRKYLALDE